VLPGRPKAAAAQLAATLRRDFAQVRVAATLGNAAGVTTQEAGGHVYICRGPVRPRASSGHPCATSAEPPAPGLSALAAGREASQEGIKLS
jgi:hypothetical protein